MIAVRPASSAFDRPDGVQKVVGQARYAADLALPGMLHACFLYAGVPHARIIRLDTGHAEQAEGVCAVLTQQDVPFVRYGASIGPIKDRTLFAHEVVRFEGEIVAAVAALTIDQARDACGLIEVEYEALEPVLDPGHALTTTAQLIHPDWQQYETTPGLLRDGNDCGTSTFSRGDVVRGMTEADVVVRERYATDMSHPVPIEPHAVLAQWEGRKLTVWSTTQVPFEARAGVAEVLELPQSDVRVIVPHLGGGFGGKCDFHFEAHVAALARKANRPVRLVLTRREEFIAVDKARHPISIDLETGVTADGIITARRAHLVLDTGAYAADGPGTTVFASMFLASGPYRIPNVLIEGHTSYTNKTPAGSTRAPSGPQLCWAVEQHTDMLAGEVGLDPIEFRLRNLVAEGDPGPTGRPLTSVGARECLRRAVELVGAPGKGRDGEGVGVACGWWVTCSSPSGVYMRVNTDGTVTVITGAQENGSGAVMALPMMVSHELKLPPERVSVLYQDTDAGPWDMGSAGSQTTFNAGRAVIAAASKIRNRLLELASDELEVAMDDLVLRDGSVGVVGSPDRSITIGHLAQRANQMGSMIIEHAAPPPPVVSEIDFPESYDGTCAGRIHLPGLTAFTFFAHAAHVRVDPETGVTRVLKVGAVHDSGQILNRTGAEGQVEGGVVHSIGMALSERTEYADGVQLNPHLLDYKLLTASDAPLIHVEFVETHAEDGPRGAKGIGEPPVVPTAGAVANAISAATGVRIRELPMLPSRVWSALQEADRN